MLVAERVNQFITERKSKPVCDGCIVDGLKLTTQAHAAQITAALGTTSDFKRERGECSLCKNERTVIRSSM
ncbi:hypothetical protein [Mesorhizobium sp. B2-3-4]|uniref:hypothetical protein n=1 Tax=Mesorhizobium sp. B2-3-4 TaxID=2589959 RepID=UPI0011271DCF|nr:hypothetical protein [Mesorhizobium sp. B2-3-4]TPM30039.1 hypothetical protein FJ967_27615 [Mesorhizobium sp. B2-3-4]